MDHSAHLLHHGHAHGLGLAIGDPLSLAGFVAMFSFSFFTSLHCAAMCGPLVVARLGRRAALTSPGIWLYNGGRLVSYTLAGAVLGYLGHELSAAATWLGYGLAIVVGLFLITAALGRAMGFMGHKIPMPHALTRWLARPAELVVRLPPHLHDFGLGVVTVFLPCMTLTPALAMAATSGSASKGAILMAAFQIGTLPIMVGATYMPILITRGLRPKYGELLAAGFLFLAGIITVLRVWH